MKEFNQAELFYLAANRTEDPKVLAKALMTTVKNVELQLAKLPEPEPQPEPPKPESPAMAALDKKKGRAIVMTKAGSEIADEVGKAKVEKLPEGVGRFRAV